MSKNGIAKFLRYRAGFNRSADQWKGEVLNRIMAAFELESVTPSQVGAFFGHSANKGTIICKTAGLKLVSISGRPNAGRRHYALEEAIPCQ